MPAVPLTVRAPPVGALESSVSVKAADGVAFPAWSVAVTTSVGELVVPAFHENVFESNGPPAGVETVEGVCDQPPLEPPSAAVADEAGPASPSLTVFVSLNEPPPATAPR